MNDDVTTIAGLARRWAAGDDRSPATDVTAPAAGLSR